MAPFWRKAVVLVVAAVVSRLPQLSSPHLLLDGDEAILGLMAKHLAEGRNAPIFFYGQAYGLSIVEAVAGAAAFTLAGVGDVQLKLAMLTIWLVGVIAMFAALARTSPPSPPQPCSGTRCWRFGTARAPCRGRLPGR